MVDSEEGSSNSKSLVERLEEAPKKIFDVMTAISKNYLTHMIGVVKSYFPQRSLLFPYNSPEISHQNNREVFF